jgi:hypothetical protein
MNAHESSDNYKAFFETMTKEQLLAGAPTINRGKFVGGLRR